ncbi:hypothetical protein SCP_0510670 [Sparassis crispa]|uniref:Uncharacterized protein n=1 Tax=Sparassis crispa TaxID=139825 RepID=A0A401GP66_9APHY|nr:hypothetical protein SCP_0510670 [Sparassis crispa]GBE84008.1 hypothetical protein SCP_0510670 [Sparassis crispa]
MRTEESYSMLRTARAGHVGSWLWILTTEGPDVRVCRGPTQSAPGDVFVHPCTTAIRAVFVRPTSSLHEQSCPSLLPNLRLSSTTS